MPPRGRIAGAANLRRGGGAGKAGGRSGLDGLAVSTRARYVGRDRGPGAVPVKVVMPLAGKGTRLRPHTHLTPKPLLKVGDKPVLSYILDDLRELGVNEAVCITGHLKERSRRSWRASTRTSRRCTWSRWSSAAPPDAIALAEPHVREELLIIFVDTLFDADLSLVKRLPDDVAGVIWAKEVEDYQRFGVIVTDDDGFMQRIVEKPIGAGVEASPTSACTTSATGSCSSRGSAT
jgi:NDP-sugar pyrophosphorylase family protein